MQNTIVNCYCGSKINSNMMYDINGIKQCKNCFVTGFDKISRPSTDHAIKCKWCGTELVNGKQLYVYNVNLCNTKCLTDFTTNKDQISLTAINDQKCF